MGFNSAFKGLKFGLDLLNSFRRQCWTS